MASVTLIDNYDSFTWNLWHYFGQLGCDVTVHRNDAVASEAVLAGGPDAIVLSPGPCTPNEAGICCDLVEKADGRVPIFGVCLGHQAIGQVLGGEVVRAPVPMHGKLSEIHHEGAGVFRGINGPFKATRYHSLIVDRGTVPSTLQITAETENGIVMGLSHREAPVHGVQFHPESILSDHGHRILQNFLDLAARMEPQPARTGVMDGFKPFLGKAVAGPLSRQDAAKAFDLLLSGEATPAQIGGFLMALRVRGETPDEIAGAVSAMRSKMVRVSAPADAIDIVGTGGDQSGSYNVSTAAALIVAGAGVKVAKHGNRALSSKSGAADVLAALGVRIELTPEEIALCIAEAGLGFMFAPAHHGAMKHVGPARIELGTRTIFNLLGPCSNPAGVTRQLLGVFSPQWLEPLAEVLGSLGSSRVLAVHGSDGLDEITTTGPTQAVLLDNGALTRFTIEPSDIGLDRASPEELKGGDGEHNAKALRAVLNGEKTAYRDIAILNAAAALMVAGKAATLREGAALAKASIDHGRAEAALQRLVAVSNG